LEALLDGMHMTGELVLVAAICIDAMPGSICSD
jgi:hypothetical protein